MKYILPLFLGLAFVYVVSGQLMVPCSSSTPEYNGPPLPVLPDQFQMNVEANIVQKNWSMNMKEYYDYPGNRGMIETYSRNDTGKMRTILNFNTKQAWIVFSNNTCKFLNTSSNSSMFGFMSGEGGDHIKTAKDLLYFGEDLGEVYQGVTQVRGIPCNHWTTCVKMPKTNGTFTLDYYFTKSSGYYIDGKQLQIPVRAVINGTGKSMRAVNSSEIHSFYHVYDFFDFKPGPIKDDHLFQVPPGVVCNQGNQSENPMKPSIPQQFSTSMEKASITLDGKSVRQTYQLHVDAASKIYRIDSFRPISFSDMKVYGNKPLTYIYDLNNELLYMIDIYGENCSVRWNPPRHGQQPQTPSVVNDLFLDMSKFTFQGQKTLREMPVMSWGFYNATSGETIDMLFYNPKDEAGKVGMHGPLNAASLVPVGLYKFRHSTDDKTPMATNEHLFDFTHGHVSPDIFDVSNCYTIGFHSTYLAFDVTGNDLDLAVQYHPKELVSKLRQIIAKAARVSPTRVLSVKWELMKPDSKSGSDPYLMVTFKLLDNKITGLKDTTLAGPSLSDAVMNLQHVWSQQSASLQFEVQLDQGRYLTLSIRAGSLWEIQPKYDTDYSSSSNLKRYGPGSMAGLGIGMLILGAILGLLAAFVIYKRIDTSVPYEITN